MFVLAQVSHENRRDDRQNIGQHAAPAGGQAPLRPRNPDCKERVARDALEFSNLSYCLKGKVESTVISVNWSK